MNKLQTVGLPLAIAMALLVLLFPSWRPAVYVAQPFKVELAISIVVFLVLLVFPSQRGSSGRKTTYLSWQLAICFALFSSWSLASLLWSGSLASAIHHTLLWAFYTAAFALFAGVTPTRLPVQFIFTIVVLCAFVLGFVSLLDNVLVDDFLANEGQLRLRYGKYAEMMLVICPLLWIIPFYAKGWVKRALLFIPGVVGWVAVMLSLSKGAFLGGVVAFIILFVAIVAYCQKRSYVAIAAGGWLALTICMQLVFPWLISAPSTADYLSGKQDPTRSTSTMRLFTWNIGLEMFRQHPIIGVGADNFGTEFYGARAAFRAAHPDDKSQEIGEDYLVERAHNEPLQVAAELGIIGLVLLALPLALFLFAVIREHRVRRLSPVLLACIAGMIGFGVSSMTSSFSFRSAPGGFLFMLIVALAVTRIRGKSPRLDPKTDTTRLSVFSWRFAAAISVLLFIFSTTRAAAEYLVYSAEREVSYPVAEHDYLTSLQFDSGYAGSYLGYGERTAAEGDLPKAARLLRNAIDKGLAVVQVYTRCARIYEQTGDIQAAEGTYKEALTIYPRSIYLLVEFASFQERHARAAEAEETLAKARSIEARDANGWYALINEGSVKAFYHAQRDAAVTPPADLSPYAAVRQYLDAAP